MKILVAGAGGFIGGHLVRALLREGHHVHAADIKPLDKWHQVHPAASAFYGYDLRDRVDCGYAVAGCDQVYNLACDMGGMGFIESHKADCMLSVLINTHLLMAARDAGVKRYLFTSSACAYAADKQMSTRAEGLRESDAYPAMPEDGYGWEKLFSERMCRHFAEDFGLETRVARIHNCYGPHGTWRGGREKAPAALCRKVLEARAAGRDWIEIWGDGKQTRSFLYIDDCIRGLRLLMDSGWREPINIGSENLVSIDELAFIVRHEAGYDVSLRYVSGPLGVRGRCSDNTLVKSVLGWSPQVGLNEGLARTYAWIAGEFERLRLEQSEAAA